LGRCANQLLDVVVERTDVLNEIFGLLFEGNEYAGLVVLDRTVVKEGHAEQGLAAAGRAAQQRGSALREATMGNLIEAANAGWRFAYGRQIAGLCGRLVRHGNFPSSPIVRYLTEAASPKCFPHQH
jgi:hypothetical protein